jgi:hypothetical protein
MAYAGEDFSPANALDDDYYCLNYVGRLPPGVTITGPSVPSLLTVVETYPGFTPDPSPSARLNGPSAAAQPLDGTSSAVVAMIQRITDLQAGNVYLWDGWALCSDGATRHLSSRIPCQPPVV